jgi:hypothetical protein
VIEIIEGPGRRPPTVTEDDLRQAREDLANAEHMGTPEEADEARAWLLILRRAVIKQFAVALGATVRGDR